MQFPIQVIRACFGTRQLPPIPETFRQGLPLAFNALIAPPRRTVDILSATHTQYACARSQLDYCTIL